ncbi:hybrid sensor histidine kinase/response regulator [Pseudoalteromonas sp. S1610]|uniref:GAF domain-containing hybrid sensor histidine kinase/response regulator n=1 Tax=unclassified Pseudoalteromonas TaxID=194690 RepID=UPI00110BE133|nr:MULTISPECIES: response regulator [unclassified Pseudoalteromonas]MCK8126269.1 response regulator [Pseudoalteromonas sp. 2CM39R]TMP61759.1 hybrid sensor histidine kinase/response regulator [Pseudoalteromonas sp. S1610]
MIKASTPEDELSRLKDLYEYDVLDTEAEKSFDDLTLLASDICETPISLISLVAPDRQWFKSKQGIDVDETARDISFCSHAILENQVFEVQNALTDTRFHDNPLVTNDPNIRFYAGAPLITPRGNAIGTLCVISDKPKKLSSKQINALTVLSKEVIAQLELRLNNKKLVMALEKQKAHNKELEKLKEEADTANNTKSKFLANMTHELRTPLHGILNLAEFAISEGTTEEKDNTLKSILKSAHYLSNIVNDILDFSKIEAGKLEIEHINFNLNDVISDVIKPQLQQASAKGIKLIKSVDPKIAENLKGDPLRVSQILNNLCSNAIKFTKTGQVELKVSIKSSTLQTQLLKFEVIDTGLGINETVQEHLFKEFHQADSSTSREYGGTGLGLSICARLSELMQGKLSFTSKIGKGSTFTYEQSFELALLPSVAKQGSDITNLKGCTVLIAEDNKINQLIIVKMLKAHNANLIIAEDGKECVKYFKEHSVDLIFMDIQMPEMDGIKATQAIRALPAGKTVPIIAMTANTLKQDIEHYLGIGMDGYLTKPFDKAKLNSLLNVYNPKNLNLKNLAVKISDPNVSSNRKLKQICKELKALIPNANRVSLWLFNKDYSALNCLACLDENDVVSNGTVLYTENSPAYFNYILTNQVLDASDARNNEVTKPFSHSYFEPLNIYSLLDYIYILDSKPLGVICCESVGSKVTWSHADKESLIKVADVTNLFLSKQIKHE